MMSRLCFIFTIFYVTGILIFTVYLRSSNDRLFYQLYLHKTKQSRLNQQLWQKQLQLESLINPAALAKRLDKSCTEIAKHQ